MERTDDTFDAIIIGAGMSGLAAGIRLALFEKKVLIVERHYAIGGLNGFYSVKGIPYDVGLHAVTNFCPKGAKKTPLTKLLRQLRLHYEDFDLHEQVGAAIRFPNLTLRFNNDFRVLEGEIAQAFPKQIDGFRRLVQAIQSFDELNLDNGYASTRALLKSYVTDPLLEDMLLLPLMYYGNADEHDMDWSQFVIMFKAIYLQGFARPYRGVRQILDTLKTHYKALGGILKLKADVKALIVHNEAVEGVVLTDGTEYKAPVVLSSIGHVETERLIQRSTSNPSNETSCEEREKKPHPGRLSFVEAIGMFQEQPQTIGIQDTIVFFNETERLDYRRSETLIDSKSGVVCCPNLYRYGEGQTLPHGIVRATALANPILWKQLNSDVYQKEKEIVWAQLMETALKQTQASAQFKDLTLISKDTFTPKTIERFTGHIDGTVYGSPNKVRHGETSLSRLYMCGTDQGFLGIIGALLSGISMANLHVLSKESVL